MTSYELIRSLRRQGGDIRLGTEGQLEVRDCPEKLKPAISRAKPRLTAWLRDLRASKEWEASGRNPDWWRDYPYSTEPFGPTCTCREYPYHHIHSDSGPPVNCDLEGEDVFDLMRKLARPEKSSVMRKVAHRQGPAESNGHVRPYLLTKALRFRVERRTSIFNKEKGNDV